jgi:FkbM family methyltransferase
MLNDTEKFVSYAQNLEDIRLWRALKYFPNGFYIDVGANHHTIGSVTLAFYQRGWRGINIEPVAGYYDELCLHRPRDVNINCAMGDKEETLDFYDIPGTGLSTFDASIADEHQKSGYPVHKTTAQVRTLNSICEEFVNGPIHFLKIDVEGHEHAVLSGLDLNRWRPWFLVIETPFEQNQSWASMVLDAGYSAVHFDGLNTYYLADEHANLAGAFEMSPGYLDNFQLCYGHSFSYPVSDLEQQLAVATQRAEAAEAEVLRLKKGFLQRLFS